MRKELCLRLTAICMVAFMALPAAAAAADKAAFVGMQIQGVEPVIAEALGLEQARGVLIRDVALSGPSDRAGFERGDLILEFAGKDIDTFKRLVSIVTRLKAGSKVPVTVLRRGKEIELTLETGSWPQGWRIGKDSFFTIPQVGVTLAAATQKVRKQFGLRWGSVGVVVTLVDQEKAKGTDLKRGELVVQIDQESVWTPRQVAAKYAEAKAKGRKTLLLLVEGSEGIRNGFRFSLLPVR